MNALAADTTVHCPADPPVTRDIRYERLWELDADDPDLPLIGVIADAVCDPDGRIYLLDMQLCHIMILGPDGAFLGTIGREGDGPAEFRRADNLLRHDDGVLGVQQGYPFRVVRMKPDGTPAADWINRTAGRMCHTIRPLGTGLVACTSTRDFTGKINAQNDIWRLSIFGETDEALHVLLEAEQVTSFEPPIFDEAGSFFPTGAWDVTTDGRVVLAPERDLYRLDYHDANGRLLLTVEREFEPRRRTREDLERKRNSISYGIDDRIVHPDCRLMNTEPAIYSVQRLPGGCVGVSHSRHPRVQDAEAQTIFDVHGPDGALRERIDLFAEPPLEDGDSWILLDDGRALRVHGYASTLRNYWSGYLPKEEEEEEDETEFVSTVSLYAPRPGSDWPPD